MSESTSLDQWRRETLQDAETNSKIIPLTGPDSVATPGVTFEPPKPASLLPDCEYPGLTVVNVERGITRYGVSDFLRFARDSGPGSLSVDLAPGREPYVFDTELRDGVTPDPALIAEARRIVALLWGAR